MLKLVKFIVGLVLLVTFAYFLFFVPLGKNTLYQHLSDISQTDEAQSLKAGIRQKAGIVTADVVENVPELKEMDEKVSKVKNAVTSSVSPSRERSLKVSDSTPSPSANAPKKSAELKREDRQALKDFLKSKLQ